MRMVIRVLMVGVFSVVLMAACADDQSRAEADGGGGDTSTEDTGTSVDAAGADVQTSPDVGHDSGSEPLKSEWTIGPSDRPARVLLPEDYEPDRPLPVIFLFHGYTATAQIQDSYFELSPRRHEREFIVVLAEGHEDTTGQQYWNATDFCCDHYGDEPDDVGYFVELLDELLEHDVVDPDRIHLVGHSNGHFFANRLACDHGDRLATVVGLAGGGHWDDADCSANGSVAMLHIHGTSDAVILYAGAIGQYPAARTLTDRWAARNDCSDDSSIYDNISVSSIIPGEETTLRGYDDCPDGADVELWSIVGGSHMPVLESDFTDQILDFALSRSNPDSMGD